MDTPKEWYVISNIDEVDTPALAVYRERVQENIHALIASIDHVNRLRPHVKTHKSAEVSVMMLRSGITHFKCATIAEAEMLATVGAPDVLLAYQPVGPKADRLAALVLKFPATHFSCLIDNPESAANLSRVFQQYNLTLPVFIDVNVGMNRTGISPAAATALYAHGESLQGIKISGLHAYDGHLRDVDYETRKKRCDEAFDSVVRLQQDIKTDFNVTLKIVAGGTPTYSIHCKRDEIACSPGTFIYWDYGYHSILKEQPFIWAAAVVTRVISKPTAETICIDLGHKAIASENPLEQRVHFLNATNLVPVGHSEEHMVFKVTDENLYEVGDVLYGIPYHICPTVALHDSAAIVENNRVMNFSNTLSRNRKITI